MLKKEDCPSRVAKVTVARSQLKSCLKPTRVASEPNDIHLNKNIHISCARWECPPKFAMDCDWHVAAAEESQEVKAQNYREARVLEAFYPYTSAIPPNPSDAADAHLGHIDDAQVPVIRLTPIEEEEDESHIGLEALDLPADLNPDITNIPGIDADAAAAAVVAYTAMLKWKEQGNLIDSGLLISILKNPELIKKHIVEDGFSEDALNEPAAMIEGISSTTDVGPKKSCDVSGPSTSTGSLPVSTLPQVNSTVRLQNTNTDRDSTTAVVATSMEMAVVATSMEMKVADSKIGEPSCSDSSPKMVKETNEPSIPNHVGIASFSWTPSVPFKMSGSNETVINNLLNKLKATCPSSRPQIPVPSFQVVPMVVTAGPGPSPRPRFPNSGLHLGPVQNVVPNRPSIAIAAGTGPSPRPDTPRPSFLCVPGPNASPVAMPAPLGTSLRHDISSLHSLPKIVPQGAPFVEPTAPPKDMEYLKRLIRKHGNGQGTPKPDHVEAGKLHNHQVPVISIGQQLTFEKPHCKFFSGPGGCRDGGNCQFEHVVGTLPNAGSLLQEAPDSKRTKTGGEFGTMK